MSEHDAAPDPIDRAYAEAEASLDDEAQRVARRARVLAAVAHDAATAPAALARDERRRAGRKAGAWLMVAGIAGLGVFVTLQVAPTTPIRAPSTSMPAPAAQISEADVAPTSPETPPPDIEEAPAPSAALATDQPAQARSDASVESAGPSSAPSAPPPPAPAPVPPPPVSAPPPSAFHAEAQAPERSLAARRSAAPPPAAQAPAAPTAEASAQALPPALGARLRAAAAAGRVEELAALLAQGAPVDAVDSGGETALMKSVRANRPAAAAILRRHGASLDLRSHAGVSARQMAAEIGDPTLDRALGLAP